MPGYTDEMREGVTKDVSFELDFEYKQFLLRSKKGDSRTRD